jgi:hypothetical protein
VTIPFSGLHVGGTSDPGNDNLLVDGTATIANLTTAGGGSAVLATAGGILTTVVSSRRYK